jgi:HSP20 family molecular chaperone IbpA
LLIRQRKEDDQKIGAEQTRFRKSEQQIKETDQQKIKDEQSLNQTELTKANEAFRQRMKANQDVYEKTLAQKNSAYDKNLRQTEKLNNETLTTQHDRLVSQLTEQKREVLRHYGQNIDQRNDPFYQVLKPETTLINQDRFYVVETKVPEKDRDNIDIRVHKDRVVISGKREYNDHLDDEGHRLVTNNYQTFREELKLSHPVDEKSFTKTYENGVLTLKIAKV